MSKQTANADAKKRARELVAQVRQRLARQEGAVAPDAVVDDEGVGASARSKIARTPVHPAGRAQRMQGRREGN